MNIKEIYFVIHRVIDLEFALKNELLYAFNGMDTSYSVSFKKIKPFSFFGNESVELSLIGTDDINAIIEIIKNDTGNVDYNMWRIMHGMMRKKKYNQYLILEATDITEKVLVLK